MPRSRKRIEITEKDEAIFLRVYEQRTMLVRQIHEQFYAGTTMKNTYARLLKLENYGYLKAHRIRFSRKWLTHVSITPLAFNCIRRLFKYDILKPSFSSSSVHHDLALVDVRRQLDSRSMVLGSLTENIIQTSDCNTEVDIFDSFQSLNTDLAIYVDNGHGKFWLPVEWEASIKKHSRLYSKLLSYYSDLEIPAVLYICKDKYIQRALQKSDKELCKDFSAKLFTCLYDDVIQKDKPVRLYNQENKIFTLN